MPRESNALRRVYVSADVSAGRLVTLCAKVAEAGGAHVAPKLLCRAEFWRNDTSCDGIFMAAGWTASRVCCDEHDHAVSANIPIHYEGENLGKWIATLPLREER